MGDIVRVASPDPALEAVDEPAEPTGQAPGAYYVAARLDEVEPSGDLDVVPWSCVRCGEVAGVAADDAPLAESCAGVLCTECSGTASGILYIPSAPDW
jgi:hypothetical protein